MFKGGTSLSKCHKIINRFSEDIDLNLVGDAKPSEGQRRRLKQDILYATDNLGLALTNLDEIRSKRDFNRYIISFPTEFPDGAVKPNLIVETAVFFRIYPHNTMTANSYIYDYLNQIGRNDVIEEFGLQKFEVEVQSLERTLIDKCFALADYYLSGKIDTHSRHIYDIYKIAEHVRLDGELSKLAEEVRIERQSNKTCLSAADDIDLNEILSNILREKVYENDYNTTTRAILFKGEDVNYSEAVKGLEAVIKSDTFATKTS